jgi:hypothetical protein
MNSPCIEERLGAGARQENMEFQIWDASNAVQRQAWVSRWQQWPDREVFAHPDYVLLYSSPGARALCATASIRGAYVLYPFLLRNVDDTAHNEPMLRGCTDITSPYGYGGPFAWGRTWDSDAANLFWRRFDSWAVTVNAVSEVIRLSLFPETLMPYPGERRVLRENIVRPLAASQDACGVCPCPVPDVPGWLWRDFEPKVRKNVNKARCSGIVIEVDETGKRLDDFLTIYTGTMRRRNAEDAYYFSREYFERIHTRLEGQFVYFHAIDSTSRVISTELVLLSANRMYSFLGGTDAAAFHQRPNDLLKVEIMNWARRNGKTNFVLGGGYSMNDGIYRYKQSFAPGGSVPFSLGCRILEPKLYERLLISRTNMASSGGVAWTPKPGFFPAYRA